MELFNKKVLKQVQADIMLTEEFKLLDAEEQCVMLKFIELSIDKYLQYTNIVIRSKITH